MKKIIKIIIDEDCYKNNSFQHEIISPYTISETFNVLENSIRWIKDKQEKKPRDKHIKIVTKRGR